MVRYRFIFPAALLLLVVLIPFNVIATVRNGGATTNGDLFTWNVRGLADSPTTETPTIEETRLPSPTPTDTPTPTHTPTPTESPTPSPTPTPVEFFLPYLPKAFRPPTPTPSPSNTPTPFPSPTYSPLPTVVTPTNTPSPTESAGPPTNTPTPTETPEPSIDTPTPSPTQVSPTATSSPTPSPTPVCGEAIRNGNFEQGHVVWVEDPGNIITSSWRNPYQGAWVAWFGGYNSARDRLTQLFHVPANAQQYQRLTFYLFVESDDSSSTAYDFFYLQFLDAAGEPISDPFLLADNTTAPLPWTQRSINLGGFGGFAGQDIQIRFEGTTDYTDITNFVIDIVSLEIVCGAGSPPPPEGPPRIIIRPD